MEAKFYHRLLWVVSIGSVSVFAIYTYRWVPRTTHGFAAYYTYSRMLLEGEDFSQAYDHDYFNSKVHEYGMTGMIDMPNNIPTNALALLPLAWLPPETAKIVWTLISLLLFLSSIKMLFKIYSISFSDDLGLGFIGLMFLWRPIYENIALGQMYFLLLFFFTLSLRGIQDGQLLQTSIPVSLAFILKGHGLIPLLWMAITKKWRAVLIVVFTIATILFLSLPVFGVHALVTYYENVLINLGWIPLHAHVAFQTLNGFINHLFTFDQQWLPHPWISLPKNVVMILSYILNIIAVIFVLRISSRAQDPESIVLSYSAAIATGVLTAPLASETHFVLFLPLVVGMFVRCMREFQKTNRLTTAWIVFIVSMLIMALPINYKALNYQPFPVILFAYSKLFAGITMLICFATLRQGKALSSSKR
ncbi:MAG: DUF2029 domain-containing protein [Ignavibacteriae bacterium]|nr:DUF2029 domain-containing protein [Ignavibacteriota bacterium]